MGGTSTTHDAPVTEKHLGSELTTEHHESRESLGNLFTTIGEKLKSSKTYQEVHDIFNHATEETGKLGAGLLQEVENLKAKAVAALDAGDKSEGQE